MALPVPTPNSDFENGHIETRTLRQGWGDFGDQWLFGSAIGGVPFVVGTRLTSGKWGTSNCPSEIIGVALQVYKHPVYKKIPGFGPRECARTIENISRIRMDVARASGTDLASSLRQSTFLIEKIDF